MVSCPLLFPPVNTGIPRRRRRQFPPPAVGTAFPPVNTGSPAAVGGNFPPPWERRFLRRQTAALFGLHLLGNPL